jgi:hypothetical protein
MSHLTKSAEKNNLMLLQGHIEGLKSWQSGNGYSFKLRVLGGLLVDGLLDRTATINLFNHYLERDGIEYKDGDSVNVIAKQGDIKQGEYNGRETLSGFAMDIEINKDGIIDYSNTLTGDDTPF